MSLSCALWATSLHQWARRYIRLTQPARCSPEKRARMHAIFADGVDKMHIPWAVEGLPTLLHLSLFLFFAGLVIFLFNVDREVFLFVVWWIGLFTLAYGLITLLPLIRHNSPYYAPLSLPVWFLYASILYLTFKVLAIITSGSYGRYEALRRYHNLRNRYRGWMLGGVEKAAEEIASKRSSEIDGRILGWTISALGDDDSLEKFFETIPGLFKSKLVKHLERDFPEIHLKTFWGALDGFMGRTSSSNSVSEPVKSRRDIICRDIISMIPCPTSAHDNLRSHFAQAPVSIETLQAMARWIPHLSHDVSDAARINVFNNLVGMQERDNRWIVLASEACGLAVHVIQHIVAMGGDDDMRLATLISVSRGVNIDISLNYGLMHTFTQFDIRHTLPGLQHDFCTLWNELVLEIRKHGRNPTPFYILECIRHLYITLHQGTDVALPTAFSTSTGSSDDSSDDSLFEPSSYPLCDIASHRPDSTAHVPVPAIPLLTQPADSPDASPPYFTPGGSTASRQHKEAPTAGPTSLSHPTKPSKIGDSSHPAATSPALPVYTSPSPTDAVAAALQDISPVATDSGENLLHMSMLAPTPTLAPVPASDALLLNNPLTSCNAGAAFTSNPFLPASSVVGFSIPASPPPPRVRDGVPPCPKTPSHPTGNSRNTTLPRLRARGLVNSGNMCFANAVLQLLVHFPPFWNLFKELMGQRGAGRPGPETGGATPVTPLVDATVKFFEEFIVEEKEPPTTPQLRQTARKKPREGEDGKKENKVVDSFEPTYMYDAMREKRQLKKLLVRSYA
jgi:hypothetical protein